MYGIHIVRSTTLLIFFDIFISQEYNIDVHWVAAAFARPTEFCGGRHPVDPLLHPVKPGVRFIRLVLLLWTGPSFCTAASKSATLSYC